MLYRKKLAEMEKELETLRSTSCTCATSQPGKECLKLLFLSKALTFYLSWNQIILLTNYNIQNIEIL